MNGQVCKYHATFTPVDLRTVDSIAHMQAYAFEADDNDNTGTHTYGNTASVRFRFVYSVIGTHDKKVMVNMDRPYALACAVEVA